MTQTQVDASVATAVTNLVDGAPLALNTLNELAAAMADDSSFAASVAAALDDLSAATQFAQTTVNTHMDGNGPKHEAVNVHVVESGGINGNDVQGALEYASFQALQSPVDTGRLSDGSVTHEKLSGNAVQSENLGVAVTYDHLVTALKLQVNEGIEGREYALDARNRANAAQATADNANSEAASALNLASQASLDVGDLLPKALTRVVGRYDFAVDGGAAGNLNLKIPGTNNPVLLRPQVTGRHFVPVGVHFILREALVPLDANTSINFGWQSNVTALGNPTSLAVEDFFLDGSQGLHLPIANPFAGANPRPTTNPFEYMQMHINGELTAGKVDVVAYGYEIPVGDF